MKSRFRLTLLLLIIGALVFNVAFMPSLQVNAQSDQCFGLSSDDCALVKGSTEPGTITKLSSFTMDYELTLTASGPKSNNVDLSVKGSGPFSWDASALGGLGTGDVKAIDKLTMANTISGTMTANGQTKTSNFEFRIVNGVLYFQGDQATQGKWMSLDLQKAAGLGAGRRPGGNLFARGGNPLQMLAMLGALRKLANTPGFITAERTADTTVENQQIASFVYHFDIPKLLNSPDFITLLKTVGSQNPRFKALSDDQIKAMSGQLATALQNSQFSITRLIGVTDKLPHGFGVDFVLNIDPKDIAGMMAMMPAASSAATMPADAQPIKVNFHFLVNLTGIGSQVSVTAPDGATPLDLGAGQPADQATPAQ